MLSIKNPLAGELRLAAVPLLTVTLFTFALASTQVLAQPTFVQPQPHYGGQRVQEMVPYQPTVFPFEALDRTPIYLDTCPEFCTPAEASSPKVVADGAIGEAGALPIGFRNGVFQKLFFTGTYIPQFENDSLGFSELEMGIVFGLPFFRVNTPLLITPRFAVNFLERPAAPDLPARVYDADITFRHLRKFGEGPWAMNASVTLGYYSDFESSDADAFRITGQALAVYESSPAATWVFGVAYLNRDDLSIIPVVGVIYEPTPDVKYEAILPQPRISWRLPGDPIGTGSQRWAYLGGEFSGDIWSIQRPVMGRQDLLTYSDFRVLVGFEKKIAGGLSRRLEIGYVFGRELQFASAAPDVRLDDSLFVRGGLTY